MAALFFIAKKTGAHNTPLSIIGEGYLHPFLPAAPELLDTVFFVHFRTEFRVGGSFNKVCHCSIGLRRDNKRGKFSFVFRNPFIIDCAISFIGKPGKETRDSQS